MDKNLFSKMSLGGGLSVPPPDPFVPPPGAKGYIKPPAATTSSFHHVHVASQMASADTGLRKHRSGYKTQTQLLNLIHTENAAQIARDENIMIVNSYLDDNGESSVDPKEPVCYDMYKRVDAHNDPEDHMSADAPRVLDLLGILTSKPHANWLTYKMENDERSDSFKLEGVQKVLKARNVFYLGRAQTDEKAGDPRVMFSGKRSFTDMERFLRENKGQLDFAETDKTTRIAERSETLGDKFYDEVIKDIRLLKDAYQEFIQRYDTKMYSSADVIQFLVYPLGFDFLGDPKHFSADVNSNYVAQGLKHGITPEVRSSELAFGSSGFDKVMGNNVVIMTELFNSDKGRMEKDFMDGITGVKHGIMESFLAVATKTLQPEQYDVKRTVLYFETSYTYYGTYGAENGFGKPRVLIGVNVDAVYIENAAVDREGKETLGDDETEANTLGFYEFEDGVFDEVEFTSDMAIDYLNEVYDLAAGAEGEVERLIDKTLKKTQSITFDLDDQNLMKAARLESLVDLDTIANSLRSDGKSGCQVLILLDGEDPINEVNVLKQKSTIEFPNQDVGKLQSLLGNQLTHELNALYTLNWSLVTKLQVTLVRELAANMMFDTGFRETVKTNTMGGFSEIYGPFKRSIDFCELLFNTLGEDGEEADVAVLETHYNLADVAAIGARGSYLQAVLQRSNNLRDIGVEVKEECKTVAENFSKTRTNCFLLRIAKACELLSTGEEPVQYPTMRDKNRNDAGRDVKVGDDADSFEWNPRTRSVTLDSRKRGLIREDRKTRFVDPESRSPETAVMTLGYETMTSCATFSHLTVATSGATAIMCQLALSPLNFMYNERHEGAKFVNYFPEPRVVERINVNNYGAFRRLYAPPLSVFNERTKLDGVSEVYNLKEIGADEKVFNTSFFNLIIIDVLNVEHGNHRKDSGDFKSNILTALHAACKSDDSIRNVSMVKHSFVKRGITVEEAVKDKKKAKEDEREARLQLEQARENHTADAAKAFKEFKKMTKEIRKLTKKEGNRKLAIGDDVTSFIVRLTAVNTNAPGASLKGALSSFVGDVIGEENIEFDGPDLAALQGVFMELANKIGQSIVAPAAEAGGKKDKKDAINPNMMGAEY